MKLPYMLAGINKESGDSSVSLEYRDNSFRDGLSVSSMTFNSLDIGSASADRYVVCIVHMFAVADFQATSVTIGGVSAQELVGTTGGDINTYIGIWAAKVPTGTTASITITSSASAPTYGVSTWKATANQLGVTTTGVSTSLAGGVGSFTDTYSSDSLFGTTGLNDSNPTWTNATKKYGVDMRSNEWMSGAQGNIIDSSGTVSFSDYRCAVFASLEDTSP